MIGPSDDHHWDAVYGRKAPEEVSWYRAHLERSLSFIEAAGLDRHAAIIDVGAGASTLVDDLLAKAYEHVTILDMSSQALELVRTRLGSRAVGLRYVVGDITTIHLEESRYDLWHDRAVFHFLIDEASRRRYVETARRALKPGGHLIVGTFGPDGPTRCSGLDVCRYSLRELVGAFGSEFELISEASEIHQTPSGARQSFVYVHLRRL